MDPSGSVLIFDDLMHRRRRTRTLCPEYKKRWKVWPERHTSPLWTSKVDFGKSVWPQSHSSIPPSRSAI